MRQETTKADLFIFLTHAGGELVLLVGLAFFLPLNRRVSSCVHQQVAPVFAQHIRTLGQRSCLALFTGRLGAVTEYIIAVLRRI